MKNSADQIQYEIRAGENAPYELVSVVKTMSGGKAVNYVTEGTYTHCNQTLQLLAVSNEYSN